MNPVTKLINHYGLSEFARKMGVTYQAVRKWERKVPAERVIQIERATNGAVTRYELRPDLYPLESEAS